MAPGDQEMPARLRLVEQFVNTHRPDMLDDATASQEWFDAALRPGMRLDQGALARLRELRHALRLTLLAHNGVVDAEEAARALAPLCESTNLGLVVAAGADPVVTGSGQGLDGFVNDVLAAVAISAIDGSWRRVKACADDDCQRAFWDRTKNRSQRFCSSARCANRNRQRAFRARQHELRGRS